LLNPLKRRSREKLEAPTAPFEALGLAAVAGLRSVAGPALLSRAVRRGNVGELRGTPFAALGSPKVSAALQLLMVGEMVGDKMPFVPSRTSAPALLGRALSGALVGAALFASAERRPASGAALGALSAIAAAYVGEKLRVKGTEKLGVPDPVLGLLEDGIVLFAGTHLLRRKS
jgi:uncharacterized membrane protein